MHKPGGGLCKTQPTKKKTGKDSSKVAAVDVVDGGGEGLLRNPTSEKKKGSTTGVKKKKDRQLGGYNRGHPKKEGGEKEPGVKGSGGKKAKGANIKRTNWPEGPLKGLRGGGEGGQDGACKPSYRQNGKRRESDTEHGRRKKKTM